MMNEILKDFLTNTFLQIKNNFWRRIFKTKDNLSFHNYELTEADYFLDLDENWRKSFPWGIYSPEEELAYYSDSAVEIPYSNNNNYLTLKTFKKKKTNHFNNATMDWVRSMVMHKTPFRNYGVFEVIAKVYPAKGAWHAPLWFVAANPEGSDDPYAVLPEPDVSEVYSSSNPNKMEVKSNLHYGKDYEDNAKSIGARTHYIPNFVGRWVTYSMVWKADRIEFYYDWHLVRICTNKEVLKRLENGMYVIIGTGVKPNEPHEGSEMEVKSFSYWSECK